MNQFKPGYSFNTLIQLLIFSVILVAIIFISLPFLKAFYFVNQLTYTGFIINGLILALFFTGLLKIVYLLLHYWREEKSLSKFLRNLYHTESNLSISVNQKSLIVSRYRSMLDIHKQKSAVNQSALASIMVAHESTRLSLPRFISNILILCGVFGTIISLSIALLGASNLLDSHGDISGMGTVIHGMSTALSTTTTAIVCYLFFGYFFQRLTDIQTYLFSSIEMVTAQHLMPRLSHDGDNLKIQLAELVSSLNQTAISMQTVQEQLLTASQKADAIMSKYDLRIHNMAEDINIISEQLRLGFRLPDIKKELNNSSKNVIPKNSKTSSALRTSTASTASTNRHSPLLNDTPRSKG